MFNKNKDIRNGKQLKQCLKAVMESLDYSIELDTEILIKNHDNLKVNIMATSCEFGIPFSFIIDCEHWVNKISTTVIEKYLKIIHTNQVDAVYIVTKRLLKSKENQPVLKSINIVDYEAFLQIIRKQSFMTRRAVIERNTIHLKEIIHSHFSAIDPALTTICNSYFHTDELRLQLEQFRNRLTNLLQQCLSTQPDTYTGQHRISTIDLEKTDMSLQVYRAYENKAEYFSELERVTSENIRVFTQLVSKAKDSFHTLPKSEQKQIEQQALLKMKEEFPLRAIKEKVSKKEYEKLLSLL